MQGLYNLLIKYTYICMYTYVIICIIEKYHFKIEFLLILLFYFIWNVFYIVLEMSGDSEIVEICEDGISIKNRCTFYFQPVSFVSLHSEILTINCILGLGNFLS